MHAPAPTAQWIRAVCVDLVGEASTHELDRWMTSAMTGATHREIAATLLRSDAYCGTQISQLYRVLLDREPDRAEEKAWTEALKSGIALQDVIAGICDSFEYKTNHPVAEAFVESLYRRLLERAADPEGAAEWLDQLGNRASSFSVIRGFLAGSEYCTQRVTELYERLLGRAPAQADLPERVVALMQRAPLQDIALELVTSSEYIARAMTRDAELAARAVEPRRAPDPDTDALALVRAGKVTDALRLLMQRHGLTVYRYCRVALGDAVLADDVQQQVFIEAHRDLPRFRARSTVRTWLLGIARHRVLDAAKRRKRAHARIDAGAAVDPADPRALPDHALDEARLQAALRACVDELEEPARTAVLLRYQQGVTYEEMAEICDENPGTLQARVARSLRTLREAITARMRPRRD